MTQPAKVQEPSMEEILASIRRIIADDEAKPAGDKAAAAPAKPAMKDIPPSAIPAAAKPAPAVAKSAPPRAPPPAPAAVPNSQDDIDAMLASLDEATPEADIRPPQPDGDVFDLTDEMALPDPPPPPAPPPAASFHKVEPQDDIEFTETAAAKALHRQPAYEPPPFESAAAPAAPQILSRSTVSAV